MSPQRELRGATGGQSTLAPGLWLQMKRQYETALDLFQKERFEEAEPLIRSVTEQMPEAPEAWYLQGLVLANMSRMEDALEALDKATSMYEQNAAPLVVRGDILDLLGRREEALEAYLAAAERDRTNWIAQESVAKAAEASGDAETAIKHYRLAVEFAPEENFTPLFRLSGLLVGTGRAEEAMALLTPYVASNPDNIMARAALGETQLAVGEPAAAVQSFAAAVDAAPLAADLALDLARAQKANQDLEAAAATLAAARERIPGNVEIAVDLGNLYGALRRYEDAAGVYETALEAAPDDSRLQRGVSIVYQRLGRIDEAVSHAADVAAREGSGSGDFAWLAVLEEQKGAPDKAMEAYERALAMEPGNWVAGNNLASLATETDPGRAVTLARAAVEASGGVPEVRDTLAWALYKSGDAGEALALFDALTTEVPGNARFAYRRGRILFETGNREAGRAEIARALDLDPAFEGAEHAHELLAER